MLEETRLDHAIRSAITATNLLSIYRHVASTWT